VLIAHEISTLDSDSFYNLLSNFKNKALELRELSQDLLYGAVQNGIPNNYLYPPAIQPSF